MSLRERERERERGVSETVSDRDSKLDLRKAFLVRKRGFCRCEIVKIYRIRVSKDQLSCLWE